MTHLACPIVCAPERATMSREDKPCALKRLMRLSRVDVGGGITPELAVEKLAVVESLLPSLTLQPGPSNCLV